MDSWSDVEFVYGWRVPLPSIYQPWAIGRMSKELGITFAKVVFPISITFTVESYNQA
jgi:hypothetical protein